MKLQQLHLATFIVSALTLETAGAAEITAGLAAWWKLDDSNGSIAMDSSGNGNTGSLINDPTWGVVDGRAGLIFDGINDYVFVADSPSLNPIHAITFTAWFWADLEPMPGGPRILQKSSDGQYHFNLDDHYLSASLVGVTPQETDALNIPYRQWQHIGFTYDGATSKMYVNGTFIGGAAASGSIAVTNAELNIGRKAGGGILGDYFEGALSDIRIYDRALSLDEIAFIVAPSGELPPLSSPPPTFAVGPPSGLSVPDDAMTAFLVFGPFVALVVVRRKRERLVSFG